MKVGRKERKKLTYTEERGSKEDAWRKRGRQLSTGLTARSDFTVEIDTINSDVSIMYGGYPS